MPEEEKTPFADEKPAAAKKEQTWEDKRKGLVKAAAGKKIFLLYEGKAPVIAVAGRGEFKPGTQKEITAEEAYGYMADSAHEKGWRVVVK